MAPTPRVTPGPLLRERVLVGRHGEGRERGGRDGERGRWGGRGGGAGGAGYGHGGHGRSPPRGLGPPRTVQRGGVGKPKVPPPAVVALMSPAPQSAQASSPAVTQAAAKAGAKGKSAKGKKGVGKSRRRRPAAKKQPQNPRAPPRAPHSTTQRLIGAADEYRSGVIFPEDGGMRLYEWGSFRGQGRLVKERLGLDDTGEARELLHRGILGLADERYLDAFGPGAAALDVSAGPAAGIGGGVGAGIGSGAGEVIVVLPVDPIRDEDPVGKSEDEIGEQELRKMDVQALRGVVRSLIRTNQRLKRKIEAMTIEAQFFKDGL